MWRGKGALPRIIRLVLGGAHAQNAAQRCELKLATGAMSGVVVVSYWPRIILYLFSAARMHRMQRCELALAKGGRSCNVGCYDCIVLTLANSVARLRRLQAVLAHLDATGEEVQLRVLVLIHVSFAAPCACELAWRLRGTEARSGAQSRVPCCPL